MSKSHGLSDEDLAGLSAEEREAIEAEPSESERYLSSGGAGITNGDDPFAEKSATTENEDAKKPAGDAPATPAETKATEPAPEAASEPAPAAPASAEAAAATAAPLAEEEPAGRGPSPTAYQARPIDPQKVEAAYADIKEKYEAGELTMDEMLAQRDRINRQVVKAEISAENTDQVRWAMWENAIERFIDKNPGYKEDVLYEALNSQVKVLAAEKDTAGKLVNEHLSDDAILRKAHEAVAKHFRVDGAAPPKDAMRELKDKRTPDLSQAPPTIGHLPAAAPQNADNDEFGHIDKLLEEGNAAAYEIALAKMSPEQQERWARS